MEHFRHRIISDDLKFAISILQNKNAVDELSPFSSFLLSSLKKIFLIPYPPFSLFSISFASLLCPGRTRAPGSWLRIFKGWGVGLDQPGLGAGTQQAEGAGEAWGVEAETDAGARQVTTNYRVCGVSHRRTQTISFRSSERHKPAKIINENTPEWRLPLQREIALRVLAGRESSRPHLDSECHECVLLGCLWNSSNRTFGICRPHCVSW